MNPSPAPFRLTRRQFLIVGAATAMAGGAFLALSRRPPTTTVVRGDTNPFAYSVARFERTDPALLDYVETGRIPLPWKGPRRFTRTPEGRWLVAADRCLGEVDPDGGIVREIPLEGAPRCVVTDADGTVFVGFRDSIDVLGTDGRRRATWKPGTDRSWFSGIAIGDGDVFVADSGQRAILRCDRSGRVLGRIGARDPDRDIPGLLLPSPCLDVKWHSDGLLRVNNPGRHRVEFYTLEGKLEFSWGRPTAAIEGFSGCCNPVSLEVLPDGRVITCEKGLPRVKVYTAHGDLDGVVAGVESFPENARAGAGEGPGKTARAGLDAVAASEDRIHLLDPVTATLRILERQTPSTL